jgi:uncharacterized protein (DUF2235 family)
MRVPAGREAWDMKRLVICCDGTWKRVDAKHATNVVKLAQAVLPQGPDGTAQITCHLDGVGTGRGTGRLAQALDRTLGGLFGQGLMATVEAAYRFLVFNYAPGDEIYLFGFSRGAFTARTLAGLIRTCGILERHHAHALPEALALYRGRGAGAHPDAAPALRFRARHAAHVATSDAELARRAGTPGDVVPPATLSPATLPPVTLRLAYLGVWDTVGSLGLPRSMRLAAWLNRGLAFHNTALSSMVARAQHAVAIDERRRSFPPTLWDNLARLNSTGASGEPAYRQRWFPGDHGSVGGGGAVTGLSDDALLWIAEGAVAAGLALDPAALAAWSAGRDCLAPLVCHGGANKSLLGRVLAWGARDRAGPDRPGDLADATVQRWRRLPEYRPAALMRVAHWLEEQAGPGRRGAPLQGSEPSAGNWARDL